MEIRKLTDEEAKEMIEALGLAGIGVKCAEKERLIKRFGDGRKNLLS